MSEAFVRRDLIDSARMRDLCTPSDFRGMVQALSHIGAIVITGALLWSTRDSAWAIPLFMIHGTLLNFLYAGQHELSHWTVFQTRWLNEWLGRLFGFVLFYPRDFDQIQHLAHHRFTQDWSQDGELARPHYDLRSLLLWMSGIDYWYTRWRRILRYSFATITEPYLPKSRHAGLVLESRIHLAGYILILAVSLWTRSTAALWLWLAPMVCMKFVHQFQNTIEHLGLPHVSNVLINTRSTRTNALMRWMCWQMQYHTAHHAFPGVPFHRLKELNAALFTERGVAPPSMTYFGFMAAAIRAFSGGKTEADYPDDAAWISDAPPLERAHG